MKTPREKYMNDAYYRALVDTLEQYVHRAQFTPSEIREAAMLACINYEMRRLRPCDMVYDPSVLTAVEVLNRFNTGKSQP